MLENSSFYSSEESFSVPNLAQKGESAITVPRLQKNIIEDQKSIVEEKNREITDSIAYAKRIQEAIDIIQRNKNDINGFLNSFIVLF